MKDDIKAELLSDTYFRGADCDADSCLLVSEVTERLSGSKFAAQKCGVEIFNLKF
jgi:hypothetical protein